MGRDNRGRADLYATSVFPRCRRAILYWGVWASYKPKRGASGLMSIELMLTAVNLEFDGIFKLCRS
jgi:hypothetical protein